MSDMADDNTNGNKGFQGLLDELPVDRLKDELRNACAHRVDRAQQVLEDIGVVDADLQHDPARHARSGIAPGREVELSQAVAADVRFGVDQPAECPGVDLAAHPTEVALPAALIAESENHGCLIAGLRDRACVGEREPLLL